MSYHPLALIILDGWGLSAKRENNAVALASTPAWNSIWQKYPSCVLQACGEAVGLPKETIGNSEVGHMNIGAGRIVYQDLTRINASVESGAFFKNPVLLKCAGLVKQSGKALHLMGLISEGGVHSHLSHLFALLDFAKAQGVEKVFVHCFMDGRDTPPHAGEGTIKKLEEKIAQTGNAAIATVIGRYYAMDRDQRWERTALAYHAITCGDGEKAYSASEAIARSYKEGKTDEFILPHVICRQEKPVGLLQGGDSVLFFNFRADRARQLTLALNQNDFSFFERKVWGAPGMYMTMTRYEMSYSYPVLFPPQNLDNVFGSVVAAHGLKQLRIAETEKYAHVTYFFNGGREVEFAGEDRALIPSPRDVPTYDLKPEMSAFAVTEEVLKRLDSKKYGVIILNFANPDMVGHSGRLDATIKACEVVDTCLGKILHKLSALGGLALVTADHGNAECMADEQGNPHTSHTLNLVPFVLFDPLHKNWKLKKEGSLCDIAPTMLQLLGIEQPKEMAGHSLLSL